MPFQIIRNDITKIKADAIVNSANPQVAIGDGVDSAIYKAAGEQELLIERRKIGELDSGEVAVTPAFALSAKYIIHTVGPIWRDGNHGEIEAVKSCYEGSLREAKNLGCESIAFPLISTGTYGFPKDVALQIAISTISHFLLENDMCVYLTVYDKSSFELSGKLFQDVAAFIDDHYVEKRKPKRPRRQSRQRLFSSRSLLDEECNETIVNRNMDMEAPMPCSSPRRLDELMDNLGETFQQMLLRLIDEKGLTDVEVYKKANLDRKLFSKIRCNKEYMPKKKTALALCIALGLNLDETKDLLSRAGLAISPSSKFDLIIQYFIENEVFDIYSINMALFQHDQSLLGE